MDTDESYIRTGHDPRKYHRPVIEKVNGTTRLTLEEQLPTSSGSLLIANRTDEKQSLSIGIEFEPYSETFDRQTILDEDVELAAGDSETLNHEDLKYGSYSATFDFTSDEDVIQETWGVSSVSSPPMFDIHEEETDDGKPIDGSQITMMQPVADNVPCEWNQDGELRYH